MSSIPYEYTVEQVYCILYSLELKGGENEKEISRVSMLSSSCGALSLCFVLVSKAIWQIKCKRTSQLAHLAGVDFFFFAKGGAGEAPSTPPPSVESPCSDKDRLSANRKLDMLELPGRGRVGGGNTAKRGKERVGGEGVVLCCLGALGEKVPVCKHDESVQTPLLLPTCLADGNVSNS